MEVSDMAESWVRMSVEDKLFVLREELTAAQDHIRDMTALIENLKTRMASVERELAAIKGH
jgi:hypothetical protein